jgi:hypothetical protein
MSLSPAKGIEKVVKKFAVQTAMYWANPVNDGDGNKTYDAPVDILVRWDDKTQVVINSSGKEKVSKAEILTNEEMQELEFLYLGALADFPSGQDLSNPKTIEGSYQIIVKSKIPFVRKTDEFVRTYFLGRRTNTN